MVPLLYLLGKKIYRKCIPFMLNEECGSFIYLGDAKNSNSKKAAPTQTKRLLFPIANHHTECQGLGPFRKNTFSLGLHNER